MLRWAVIFLVIGLVAGLLGFTGIAGTSVAIAKTLRGRPVQKGDRFGPETP